MFAHTIGRFLPRFIFLAVAIAMVALQPGTVRADDRYGAQEIVDAGHRFFGSTTGGLATLVEKIFASYGLPNGYVLGEEGSGAIVGGLTYGEGTLFTKNAGDHKVFWQGPSIGWDFGGQGSRTMMLVYNMNRVDELYHLVFPDRPMWWRASVSMCSRTMTCFWCPSRRALVHASASMSAT